MKNRLYIPVLIFLYSLNLFGVDIDSLKQSVNNFQPEKQVNILLGHIHPDNTVIDDDDALNIAEYALNIAIKAEYGKGIANAKFHKGAFLTKKHYFEDAEHLFRQSLKIYQGLGNKDGEAQLFNALGQLNKYSQNYVEAIKYYEKAIAIKERLIKLDDQVKDKKTLCISYQNIGQIYSSLSDHLKALEYHLKSYYVAKLSNNKFLMYATLDNIALTYYKMDEYDSSEAYYLKALEIADHNGNDLYIMSYNDLACVYKEKKDFPTAFSYFWKSVQYARDIRDTALLSMSYANLGKTYSDVDSLDKAREMLDIALGLALKIDDREGIADAFKCLGELKMKRNNINEAIELFRQSGDIYQLLGNMENQKVIYKFLSDLYAQSGNYKKSLEAFKEYSQLNDTLMQIENQRGVDAVILQARAENDYLLLQKDYEIQKAEYASLMNIIIFGALACVSIILSILIYLKMRRIILDKNQKINNKIILQRNVYNMLTNDMKKQLFDISMDIAKIDDIEQYNKFSASFNSFTKKYNYMLEEMKAES